MYTQWCYNRTMRNSSMMWYAAQKRTCEIAWFSLKGSQAREGGPEKQGARWLYMAYRIEIRTHYSNKRAMIQRHGMARSYAITRAKALMDDAYMPYLGLFFLFVSFFFLPRLLHWKKKKSYKKPPFLCICYIYLFLPFSYFYHPHEIIQKEEQDTTWCTQGARDGV